METDLSNVASIYIDNINKYLDMDFISNPFQFRVYSSNLDNTANWYIKDYNLMTEAQTFGEYKKVSVNQNITIQFMLSAEFDVTSPMDFRIYSVELVDGVIHGKFIRENL